MLNARKLDMLNADVIYYPKFFSQQKSQDFMAKLIKLKEAEWHQSPLKIFGKILLEPRLSAYYGDYPYRYSGFTREPLPWNPVLLEIKSLVEPIAGVEFNAVFLNLYRNGNDSVGWHSDDQKELGSSIIASVSFGATRRFIFRRKDDKTIKVALDLSEGDVLIMGGETQKFWHHQVPKSSAKNAIHVKPRINLTYRFVVNPQQKFK